MFGRGLTYRHKSQEHKRSGSFALPLYLWALRSAGDTVNYTPGAETHLGLSTLC